MKRIKKLLIIVGVVVLLGAVAASLRWRQAERMRANEAIVSSETEGGAFVVVVEAPMLTGRPPWEIPAVVLGFSQRGPKFDQTSGGAKVIAVAKDRLELMADGGWNISIVVDSEGKLAPETHLQFPIELGNRPLVFDCRPAEPPVGHLISKAGANAFDGSFVVDVVKCTNAKSGKIAEWPYEPLRIRGSFKGLMNDSR